ncbi:two-component system, chemotaxis family, chemotaxis protein CheY [Janthinobacterium sp. CG_23.3]|uniref:response regulator n=1 Tax=unclassified Janthinobacterium TaxID=2610881 RepID=UPI00034AE7B7|nr:MULTISPECIES: response regulator [unclassified Janthinobacterium]MEC5163694.1 two-component system chemotaxis response regulator CheY [Janthinobacterium sp. CG_S6]
MNQSKTVLIVDDSRVSRLMAHQFVLSKKPDWTVVEAATGEEALAKAPALQPVLILMDVNMPGMGGMAAAEQLRALCPHSHISLVTANVQNATRNRATELGIGFMEKPITEGRIHQLLNALES